MSKFTVFIADLHLDEAQPTKTQKFFELLNTVKNRTDALYILGDFFEAWAGDDDDSQFVADIKVNMLDFSRETPIYVMRGNRDFLLGKRFAAETGCTIIEDPSLINLYGITTILTHGDHLCTNDRWYLRLRKVANTKSLQKMFLLLPFVLRKKLAKIMRNISKKRKIEKSTNESSISTNAVIELMRIKKAHLFIHGHFHRPEIKDIPFDGELSKMICLPNWDDYPEALIYKSNQQLYFEKI